MEEYLTPVDQHNAIYEVFEHVEPSEITEGKHEQHLRMAERIG